MKNVKGAINKGIEKITKVIKLKFDLNCNSSNKTEM